MIKLKRLYRSFTYSYRGLKKVFREEQNVRMQMIFGLATILLALVFKIRPIEWCIIILSMGFVLLAETVNSAMERATDMLKPRISEYVKVIKDIMAAAVMISAITAVMVGLIIFIPYILKFLRDF